MRYLLNKIALGLIFMLGCIDTATADHNTLQPNTVWFSSDTSTLLNRSSIELATNHLNRGIYFAKQALKKNLNTVDQLIANHNLCIAYLASDETTLARQYCAHAYDLAQESYRVVKIRGALRIQEFDINNKAPSLISPVQMITNNIQNQGFRVRLSQLMK